MSTPARKRLLRDFKRLQKDAPHGIQASPLENDIMSWQAIILGPDDTVWEGGIFLLLLNFTEEYPNKPPLVKFKSNIFHPNVYADGKICLDILQNQWSPIYDISGKYFFFIFYNAFLIYFNLLAILTSIQSLLCDPNPASPANAEASQVNRN